MDVRQRYPDGPVTVTEQVYEDVLQESSSVAPSGNKQAAAATKSSQSSKGFGKHLFILELLLLLLVTMSAGFSITVYLTYKKSVYKSCKELKDAGFSRSSIYEVKPDNSYMAYKVYCDMTSDGGGWTLVASVHDADPQTSCSSSDRWSLRPSSYSIASTQLWSNGKTTGSIGQATSDDFKSKAYSQPASDVLISHVPNDTPIEEVEDAAFLKYHTYDHFLDKYGSSLQELYRNYAPLKDVNLMGIDEKVISLIKSNSGLVSSFSDWYSYIYDAGSSGNRILDGGNDMFDIGNKVYFSVGDEPYKLMNYGKSYTDFETYHISSAATHPFVTIATVTANGAYLSKFRIKVESTAYVGAGKSDTQYASYKNLHGQFHNVYNRGSPRPTICKLFFYKRGDASSFNVRYPSSTQRGTNLTFEMRVYSNPLNAFIGYMLLSRQSGQLFNRSEIEGVLKKVAQYADHVISSKIDAQTRDLIFPVKYLKGYVQYSNPNVTSGFLQLRPFDNRGAPYAMCPGVKLSGNADPALYCIGSGNAIRYDYNRCGDFAVWYRLEEHTQVNRRPDKNGTFVNDLRSTIMIFTR